MVPIAMVLRSILLLQCCVCAQGKLVFASAWAVGRSLTMHTHPGRGLGMLTLRESCSLAPCQRCRCAALQASAWGRSPLLPGKRKGAEGGEAEAADSLFLLPCRSSTARQCRMLWTSFVSAWCASMPGQFRATLSWRDTGVHSRATKPSRYASLPVFPSFLFPWALACPLAPAAAAATAHLVLCATSEVGCRGIGAQGLQPCLRFLGRIRQLVNNPGSHNWAALAYSPMNCSGCACYYKGPGKQVPGLPAAGHWVWSGGRAQHILV